MRLSSHWKLCLTLFPIIGTCVLASPGGQRGFFQAWYGATFSAAAGPTDYLHFYDPAGTLTSEDQGPGEMDGTPLGGLTETISEGWDMGTDDNKYVNLDGPITNGTSYTITVWIKPDITAMNLNNVGGWIVSDRGASALDFQFYYDKSNYRIDAFDASVSFATDTETNVQHNVWQHLAAVVDDDNDTIQIFVNGTSDGSNAMTLTPNDAFTGLASVGQRSESTGAARKFHGSIGKVRIYQRALSQAEIQSEYEADGETGP